MADKLKHVGVLGMKWGHHKRQEETARSTRAKASSREVVLRKGETVRHITDNEQLSLANKALYTSFTPKDILRYRGEYADQVRMAKNVEKIFEYKLTATKDLVSPSKQRRIDAIIELHKSDKNVLDQMAKSKVRMIPYLTMAKNFGFDVVAKEKANYKKLLNSKDPKDQEKALHAFSQLLGMNDTNRVKYFNKLKKEGFNSIYDDNDIAANYSDKPLIIFDSARSLRIKGKESFTQDQTDEAFAQLERFKEGN